ncbi:hypothetical protein ACP4OV_021203 [Aristida adscensionis]
MAAASAQRPTHKPSAPAPPASRTPLIGEGFRFPTPGWGTQRLLRCSKGGSPAPAPASASASPPPQPHTPSPEKEKPPHGSPGEAGEAQPPRPWNLRTRRSATVAPLASRSEAAGKKAAAAAGQAQQPLARSPAAATKRGFSIALTKEEIAEDLEAIRGSRPTRRPRKRRSAVQRQVDMLCPGLSLAEVTLDSYKVKEVIGAMLKLQIGGLFRCFQLFVSSSDG